MLEQVVEVAGAVMILAAYGLAQFAGLDRHGRPFLSLNAIGGVILAVLAGNSRQWGFFLLQAIWALIALWGLIGPGRRSAAS